MKVINSITLFEDSAKEDHYPNFSSSTKYTTNQEDLIPEESMTKILNHLKLDNYKDTIIIAGVVCNDSDEDMTEEIWDASEIFESLEVIDSCLENNNSIFGHAEIGFIDINGTIIPAYYVQDACPIGFVINSKYLELVEKNLCTQE